MNTPAENLLRWEESGDPRKWVDHRNGQWTHEDWEALLSTLEGGEYWPMDPGEIGVLLEKLRKASPTADSACAECGHPNSAEMAARDVEVMLFRVLATFACPKCKAQHKVDFTSIDKAEGVEVRCLCGAIAHIPASVWCQTCGKGLSTGWQSSISRRR